MGLDMYLEGEKSIWDHHENGQNLKLEILKTVGLEHLLPTIQFVTVKIDLIYWRKANAIHKWFINNCADGIDDCRECGVEMDQLKELLDICKQVKANPEKAEELLPTEEGFFFGTTEYDEFYYSDINQTIEDLTRITTDPKLEKIWFTYRASW